LPVQVEYKWLGQGEGVPLLQVNEVGGTVTSVVYKGLNLLGTSSLAKKNFEFSIFPNPVADHLFLNFQMQKPGDVEITITGITGNVVTSMVKKIANAGDQRFLIDLPSGIEAGTYQVKVTADNSSAVKSFIITK